MRTAASWLVGILIFLAVSAGGARLLVPAECRDGWHALSIEEPSLCSERGGLDHANDILICMGIAAGALAGINFHYRRRGHA